MTLHKADKNSNGYLEKQEVADLMVAVYEMGGWNTKKYTPDVEDFFATLAGEITLEVSHEPS